MAFHPYPQLIQWLFNANRFGPSRTLTCASPWPWIDHQVSGLPHATIFARLGLAFATASSQRDLTSLHRITRRFIMQKARGHTARRPKSLCMVLPLLVGIRFQVLFHSPSGVLFTFPSRYLCTIGHQRVFSLRRWSSRIPTGFLVSRGTWVFDPESLIHFTYRTITLYGEPFQTLQL